MTWKLFLLDPLWHFKNFISLRMSANIVIHKGDDFDRMRSAGWLAADVLDYIEPAVVPGVSTLYLNDLCHDYIINHGGVPAPLNYKGFPKSVCTSINNVICHGIPEESQLLKDGDIINVDVTVILNGWHGDTSRTFLVGESFKLDSGKNRKTKKLVSVAQEAMQRGIEVVKPGAMFSHIGSAIQNFVEANGFSVVRDYCGHGIGREFHAAPQVLHYCPKMRFFDDLEMRKGMFFTIEPMVNAGSEKTTLSKTDGWTVYTRDGYLSAQFEHTIGVTDDGCEIFTLPKGLRKK